MGTMKKLKYECSFCGESTNFKDDDRAYCIDCYAKLRDSAHTHQIVNPLPVTITPMPQVNPYREFPFPPDHMVIC